MKKLLKVGLLSVITSSVIVGCGGGSSSSTNTGYFIDAAVAGLDYNTSSNISGTTDQYGRFHYADGDSVSFSIGDLELGDAVPQSDGLVTPEEIAKGDEVAKTTILRVLQSIDSDNNTSNGITVPKEIVSELKKLSKKVNIRDLSDNDEELLQLNKKLSARLDKNQDGHIDIDEAEAKKHFENSMQKWTDGQKPDHGKKVVNHNNNDDDNNDNNTNSDFDNQQEHNNKVVNNNNDDDNDNNTNSDFDDQQEYNNKVMKHDNSKDNDNTNSDFNDKQEHNNNVSHSNNTQSGYKSNLNSRK